MRSRLDDLSTARYEIYSECCSECDGLYVFEEARVTRQGRFLEIMLLCPECGHREKVALHSWYERRSGSDTAKQSVLIPAGYHLRLSGSTAFTHDPVGDPLFCDLCKRPASHLAGYEKECHPDIFVCSACELETAIAKQSEMEVVP